jgi:hypothetical protein
MFGQLDLKNWCNRTKYWSSSDNDLHIFSTFLPVISYTCELLIRDQNYAEDVFLSGVEKQYRINGKRITMLL